MKKILGIILLLMCLAAPAAMADGRAFQKFPGSMQINTVYISPTAIKLGLNLAGNQLGAFSKIIKKPESIEIISTYKYDSHSALNQECKEVVQKNNMELILNCADRLSKTNIYIGELINDKEIRDIIIESQEGSSYSVVYIKGIIDAEELMKSYNNHADPHNIESITVDSVEVHVKRLN